MPGTVWETSVNKPVKQNPCFFHMDSLVKFTTTPQFPDSELSNYLGLNILKGKCEVNIATINNNNYYFMSYYYNCGFLKCLLCASHTILSSV